ncbi:MAG: PspC domain-containing protein [Methanomassiliicoccales archaeon]|nr:MAG: PspC domain-containing protein [Methanomassiliicoccales archaeon]
MTENWTENQRVQHPPSQPYNQYNYTPRKLYRSTRDKWIAGVCGGIAERYNHDPTLIRILWIVLTIFAFPAGIIAYILLWIFVKKYPSYYTLPPPIPPEGAESVHYHYYYKSPQKR